MPKAGTLRSYLAELVVVFVGVALAIAVDNLREARNDRTVGDQYLSAFRQDLTADLKMFQTLMRDRRVQNGLRLIVVNLDSDRESLLPLLEMAKTQVVQLLRQIPAK